jgi:hypothetical protein
MRGGGGASQKHDDDPEFVDEHLWDDGEDAKQDHVDRDKGGADVLLDMDEDLAEEEMIQKELEEEMADQEKASTALETDLAEAIHAVKQRQVELARDRLVLQKK